MILAGPCEPAVRTGHSRDLNGQSASSSMLLLLLLLPLLFTAEVAVVVDVAVVLSGRSRYVAIRLNVSCRHPASAMNVSGCGD